jgi:glycerol-3-phosphate dehydrogenase subunit C
MIQPSLTVDQCLKCNICTAACPVAAATDLFPGPKAVGPQAQRYRHPALPLPDRSLAWCSGCGTCSRVCPHGVAVAELNIQAKAQLASQQGIPLRDQIISRPDWLGRLALPFSPLANGALQLRLVRCLMQKVLRIHRDAPMPAFRSRTFRSLERARLIRRPAPAGASTRPRVAYFHGCSTNYYEPELGKQAIAILEYLGCEVTIPPQGCCGLPLQSNGLFHAARAYATRNIRLLAPFARQGYRIVGTSTSCTLSLKHDYRVILGLGGEEAELVARNTLDFFEFLTTDLSQRLIDLPLQPLRARALYHPPCQLKAHGIGTPALLLLRRIPGLVVELSDSECCGVAGTYGLKQEKYAVAHAVGSGLFERLGSGDYDFAICDSETCRWWISGHAHVPVLHPLQVLAQSLF